MPRPTPLPPSARPLVLPAKQARSRQTRDRLLATGRLLLDKGVFEETTIAELARRSGCSVGSFYFRFQDKEAFYLAVLAAVEEEVAARVQQRVNEVSVARLSAARTVETCIDVLIDLMDDYQGMVRTVQYKGMINKDSILPLQRIALRLVKYLGALIQAKYGEHDNPAFERNIEVGFQVAFSVMQIGLMNRPPVLNPDSPDYRFWIREMMMHALSVKGVPTAPARNAQRAA